MDLKNIGLIGCLSLMTLTASLPSCGKASGGGGSAGSAGQPGEATAGQPNEANGGNFSTPGGAPGGFGGATEAGEAAGGSSESGQGGAGVGPEVPACSSSKPEWWNAVAKTCQACPAKATVQCSEVATAASYDARACTLTVPLPPGRAEIVAASLAVTFNYSNNAPEVFADVKGSVAGDIVTFDFTKYGCAAFSNFSGEPSIKDACGDYVELKAPGAGFGPAIMVQVTPLQGEGGGASTFEPEVTCGKTN